MKCVLCDKKAKYTTYWDAPTPLCEDCAFIEADKLWKKSEDHCNFDLNNFYDPIVKESSDAIYASSINTKTGEYK